MSISDFRSFLNKTHAQMLTLGADDTEADQILDQVDAFDHYCQNTTMSQNADPKLYAHQLCKSFGIGIYDYAA